MSRAAWLARSTGLVSTRWTGGARPARAIARKASADSVPRPGPSSTHAKSATPARIARSAAHSPISSPNIWLISGAVTKSPPRPSGSRVA